MPGEFGVATTAADELLLKATRRDSVLLVSTGADGHEDAVTVLYEVTEDCVQLQDVTLPSTPMLALLEPE